MISAQDITRALAELGLASDDVVLVHSGLQRALGVEGSSREQKLDTIVHGLQAAVADGALLMPAFSYSFCRGESFDVQRSPSVGLGVLPEHFRGGEGVRRTADPLFSASVSGRLEPGWDERLFCPRDVDCFGAGSVFDFLHAVEGKLLFFGVPATANTYVHHVEQRLRVPYRYFKDFHGAVIDGARSRHVTARYYVRDLDADVDTYLAPLGDDLLRSGRARAAAMERGPSLYLTDARAVVEQVAEGVRENPSYLLRRGHPQLTHRYPLLAP